MNSGKWDKIVIPSCWEQQGFDAYNYGHDKFENRFNNTRTYKYIFAVPANWKNRQISIVFDGVMTDAEIKISGKVAVPVHQGPFYQFKYNISKLLNIGQENHFDVSCICLRSAVHSILLQRSQNSRRKTFDKTYV